MAKKTRAESEKGATGAEATGPEGEERDRERSAFDVARENLEAFLVAVILAIVIRHFAVEAFEIPTGSMANTLFGLHAWLECPNCSTEYNLALQSDSSTGEIRVPYRNLIVYAGRCGNPNCTLRLHSRNSRGTPLSRGDRVSCGSCGTAFPGEPGGFGDTQGLENDARCPLCHHIVRNAVIEKKNKYGGHKILVTKFAYAVGKPQRWDVIVFEFDQWKNYIKRLVGLPGERIEVWDGDLYVNGQIERKSKCPRAEEALWTKISDSDVAERGLNGNAWAEVAPLTRGNGPEAKSCQWNKDQKRWSMNSPQGVSLLKYQRGFDNYYNYNLLSQHTQGYLPTQGCPPNVQVGDKKVSFRAKVLARDPAAQSPAKEPDSWVGAEIRDGDFTFQLRIPVGSPSEERPASITRLKTDEGPRPSPQRDAHVSSMRVTKAVAIPVGASTQVDFENLDDRVSARVNGDEILAIEYSSLPKGGLHPPPGEEERPPGEQPNAHYVLLIAAQVQVELDSVRVYRDMYYIPLVGRDTPWPGIQLEAGQYFAMGDNAPSSSDGRYWGAIPEHNLMGKALLVFWPAWPLNFQWKFIK